MSAPPEEGPTDAKLSSELKPVAVPLADNNNETDEAEKAPTLVEAKLDDVDALQKDPDDESPKTFPQVVSTVTVGKKGQ